MDRSEERTTFCKRRGAHTLDDAFTCLPPAHPLRLTEAVDSLERSIQQHMNPQITYRPTIPSSGFMIRLHNVTKKKHGVSLDRLTSSQWSNSYRFFFRPGSNSRRRACSSSSVIKPVLTCTWEPSLCTSSRLDPKTSSSSEADKGRLLAQPRRPAPAAGLWIRLMTDSNSFILLFQMLTVICNSKYFWQLASSWVSKWSVWEPCLKCNAHWEM